MLIILHGLLFFETEVLAWTFSCFETEVLARTFIECSTFRKWPLRKEKQVLMRFALNL